MPLSESDDNGKVFEGQDYMVRALAANKELRAFSVTSRNLTEYARKAHGLTPLTTAALGRTMAAGLMMSDMLKDPDGLLTIRFRGDGPIGGITVTADNHGDVKGFVQNPLVVLPEKPEHHLDVGRAVGRGTLSVIRDMDRDHTYNGQVAIHSGEIADDLTYYFAESEQIPSSVGLGVLVDRDLSVRQAGGFIIQLLPFASEETISKLESNLREIPSVTEMLDSGMTPEDLLRRVLDGFDVEITERIPVRFYCNCSRDRVERALKLLGKDEIGNIAKDRKDEEIRCHFCGKKYRFSAEEIQKIYTELLEEEKKKKEKAEEQERS
ncbi:MAG: Hsp33 family molecular chaperone HslO [Eubacteriales bacterium]|nr:Hsp33 family molecular chaperone HslO [Eubacteriales bacterium]